MIKTEVASSEKSIQATYNANLFELTRYKPLSVSRFHAEVVPRPKRPGHFYQVLGRFARKLTKDLSSVVISEGGEILTLESTLDDVHLSGEIPIEDVGTFRIQLTKAGNTMVNFADSPLEYERLVKRMLDIAMVQFAPDYYKYHDLSPYIIERGQGFFPQSLREKIGVEDGRQFYRGVRVVDGLPHILVNRTIQLRSWKHLLNELKVLANWFTEAKGIGVDFYSPPEAFVKFANWSLRNRTANNRMYSARPLLIREILWDKRANDIIPDFGTSIVDYQKSAHGVVLEDPRQPLVKYDSVGKDGLLHEQFQAPELLVVGHNFRDLSMRVPSGQVSQVWDILQPHCGDQQRRIFDFVTKADRILRSEFSALYPSKLEFSTAPRDVTDLVVGPFDARFRFRDSIMKAQPPYGPNFYRRYTKAIEFAKPIGHPVECLALCGENEYSEFLAELSKDFARRNGYALNITRSMAEIGKLDPSKWDLVLTFLDEGEDERMEQFKGTLINTQGIAHQNITSTDAKIRSIPQVTMQIVLKLGGYPRFLADPPDLTVLSVHSYRNPFDDRRFYLYNVMSSQGEVVYQSKPFLLTELPKLLEDVKPKLSNIKRLLVLTSYDDQALLVNLISKLTPSFPEISILTVFKGEDLRVFSTYRPMVSAGGRRRRSSTFAYPIEAYEFVPQGIILRSASREYHIIPTSSTKLATYYRGCPTTVRLRIRENTGKMSELDLASYVLQLCTVAGTSGHPTRLPAPLYYLKLLAYYISKYGLPTNEKAFQTLFYV